MTKLTIELLEKFVNDIKTDGMCDITDSQVESALIRLLAYERAAKNPVAWIVHMRTGDQFTTDSDFVGLGESTHGIHSTPLYAAPVLPKQPESESIICWSCKKTITLTQHAEADGFCPLCDAEIELEPTQPEPLMGTVVSIDDASGLEGHRQWGEVVGLSESRGKPVICVEVTGYQYE